MMREPHAIPAFVNELEAAHGENAALDAEVAALKDTLVQVPAESGARRIVERMALALQAATLVRHAPHFVADAFCATRLGDKPGLAYGATNAAVDTAAILARAAPQL
jgi:putative acyl-CoA dehydrogenase